MVCFLITGTVGFFYSPVLGSWLYAAAFACALRITGRDEDIFMGIFFCVAALGFVSTIGAWVFQFLGQLL